MQKKKKERESLSSKLNVQGSVPNEKPKNYKSTVKRFALLLKPHGVSFVIVVISSMFCAVMSIFGPSYLGDIIDAIQTQVTVKLSGGVMDFHEILSILGELFIVYTVSVIATYIQHYVMAGIVQKVIYDMREKINQKLSKLPLSYYDANTKGEVLSKVTNDIDNISNTLQNNLTQIILSLTTLVGVFIMMWLVSWRMTLIALSVIPACLIVALAVAKHSKKYFRRQWDCTGEINGHIEEMYTGHKVVRVFDHEEKAIEDFDRMNEELFAVSKKAQFISGLVSPLLTFLNNIGYIMICVAGGVYVFKKTITLGDVTAFITYSRLFTQPILNLGNIANNIQSCLASGERVFELLDQAEQTPDIETEVLENVRGDVKFENVCFSYDKSKSLIKDLNLDVKAGQVVAIVGSTGAGKTTIVNLLMRFYDIDSGKITVDGVDINRIPRNKLRQCFGMALQDAWLFKGTIMENLRYAMDGATNEQVYRAAEKARANHFISTLQNGYDTVLEEDGSNLSQGQRQLLTIARALLSDPKILILDEATSSVDTRTEILIQKAMKDFMKGRTSFVIAHRLSTIRDADIILVVENGRVVEQGNHEQLLSLGGAYAELYQSQFGG